MIIIKIFLSVLLLFIYPISSKADDNKAQSINLNILKVKSTSLSEGKISIKFYVNDWLDSNILSTNMQKISINGINDLVLDKVGYEFQSKEEHEKDKYYIQLSSYELKPNHEYKIKIESGFGDDKYTLKHTTFFNIKTPHLEPFVAFSGKEPYLSSVGAIGIKSANIVKIKATLYRLSDQNYRYFLNFSDSYDSVEQYSKEVLSQIIQINQKKDSIEYSKIKLNSKNIKDGVYELVLEYQDTQGKNQKISKKVYLSDMAISVKVSDSWALIFVSSLSKAKPISEVKLKLYSDKNELLATALTQKDGTAKINLIKNGQKMGKALRSITAQKIDQQSFIILNEHPLNQTASIKDYLKERAWIYLASNLIKPNENIKALIVLKNLNFTPISNLPVRIKITDPQNQKILDQGMQTDEFGTVKLDQEIKTELTGDFDLSLIYKGKVIANKKFQIQNFEPNTIQTIISQVQEEIILGDEIKANIESRYMFGAPASNLDGQGEISFYHADYKDERYDDYTFNFKSDIVPSPLFTQINLDNKASAKINLNTQRLQNASNFYNAVLSVNLNEGSKTSITTKTIKVFAYPTIIGIHTDKANVNIGEKINIQTIVLNSISKTPAKDQKTNLKIYLLTYNYIINEDSSINWHTQKKLVYENEINKKTTWVPKASGEYMIEVSQENGTQTQTTITVGDWIKPDKNLTKATIKLNKKSYKAEDELVLDASSVLKSGIAIFTLESDSNIILHKVVEFNNQKATANFKLPSNFSGGYASVSMYRITNAGILPYRAYAKTYIKTEQEDKKIQLKIQAPQKINSNSELNIKVTSLPNSLNVLFIADVGALDIIRQASPKPFDFFNSPKAQSVLEYDIYSKVAGFGIGGKELKFGGDGATFAMMAKMARDANPLQNTTLQNTTKMLFAKSNKDGIANFKINFNGEYKGKIRADVVSLNKDKIASKSQEIIIKDDIAINLSKLKYMLLGDDVNMAFTVSNTTNKAQKLQVNIKNTDNLITTFDKQIITINPNQTKNINMNIKAIKLGEAKLDINVGNFKDSQIIKILSPYEKKQYFQAFFLNGKKEFNIPKDYEKINLNLSKLPQIDNMAIQVFSQSYQNTQIIADKLLITSQAKNYNQDLKDDIKIIKEQAKEWLKKVQKPSGEYGFFSPKSDSNKFASIYATFALSINEKNLNTKWLRNLQTDTIMQELLKAYTLSLNSNLPQSDLNALYDNKKTQWQKNIAQAFLMIAILKENKMDKEANKLLKIAQNLPPDNNEIDLHSSLRDEAIALYIQSKYFTSDSYTDQKANYLIKNLNNINNNHERAWIIVALNEYLNLNNSNIQTTNTVNITQDNQSKDIIIPANIHVSNNFLLSGSSFGNITALSTKEPKITNPIKSKSNKLSISREFVDHKAQTLDLNNLKQNTIIYSKITINAPHGLRNGVVSEIISRCFEPIIFNEPSRIKELENTAKIDFTQIQDDKVLTFLKLNDGQEITFYTPYRVLLNGKCSLGQVNILDMQNIQNQDYNISQKNIIVN